MSDFGYVKDCGLQFNGALVPRKSTVRIIEHHTSGGAGETVQGVHNYHLSKGHKGIDYNFCVLADGTVVNGRGLEYCGGSVNNSAPRSKGMNDNSVAIVALGDFEHNQMPEAQKEGLKRITRDVAQHYGITEIIRHKDVSDTDCPGQYFPFDEIKAYALGGGTQSTPTPQEPENDAAWNVDHTLYRPCHVELKNYMNFRTGPGEEHSVIRQLHNGDKMVLLENCENNWLKVLFLETGEQGYVFSEWIVFDGMMRGEDVRGLQRAINKHTGLGISEDAALGDKTAHGIVQLQKALGLKQDGQAGKDTVTAAGGKWTKK